MPTRTEAAAVVKHAQTLVVSHYAQKMHGQFFLTVDLLINRYAAELNQTYNEAAAHMQYVHGIDAQQIEAPLKKLQQQLQTLGRAYISLAGALGYERALRDLTNFGWLKWFQHPVKPPYAALAQSIDKNDSYIAESFIPALKLLLTSGGDPATLTARIEQYSHWLWRSSDAGYRYCLSQYREQTGYDK